MEIKMEDITDTPRPPTRYIKLSGICEFENEQIAIRWNSNSPDSFYFEDSLISFKEFERLSIIVGKLKEIIPESERE